MSRWRHAICDRCWVRREGDRNPVRVLVDSEADCCFCAKPTSSGIYVRGHPDVVPCRGEHGES